LQQAKNYGKVKSTSGKDASQAEACAGAILCFNTLASGNRGSTLFSCLVFKAILAPLLCLVFGFALPAAAQTARHRTALNC
jgi:hypothetical protein